MYLIQEDDKFLVLQRELLIGIKLEVYEKDESYINEISGGVIQGNSNIASESAIRRTATISFYPDIKSRRVIEEGGYFWIDKLVKIYIGLTNIRTKEVKWYKQGTYFFGSASMTYDATTDQIELSCSDLIGMLDGTKNGQLGQKVIKIPAYEENEKGEVVKYNVIRESLIDVVTKLGNIKKCKVDHIGEYQGMPQYNPNYMKYREEQNKPLAGGGMQSTWNAIPYDLEYNSGTNVLNIIQDITGLYPNYEFYMDIDNYFCCNMIPSCEDDDSMLDESFMKKILISENTSLDLTQVKNVVEIWGSTIDPDCYADSGVSYSGNVYSVNIEGYDEKYYNGDKVGMRIPATNNADAGININNFGAIPIYDDNTNEPLKANTLDANEIYVFVIKSIYLTQERISVFRAYLLGRYEVHAVAALVGNKNGKYNENYFKNKYGCEYVYLEEIKDSPFTVEKIGEILAVKTGKEFEKIESSSVGLANAKYQLWQSARLTDNITITTKLCPFMDVNQKITYTPHEYDSKGEHQYIVKSLAHDWTAGTTTWNLMRFYPLYQ